MNRQLTRPLFVLFFMLFVLPVLACDAIGLGNSATETPAATNTPASTSTPEATATAEPTATLEATNTPEPTPTAEIDANFTTYESGVTGVSVSYPRDWVIQDLFFLGIASEEELLEDPTGIDDGAVVAIFSGDSDETGGGTAEEQLDTALEEMDFEEATLVDGPTSTEIQGQEATLATLETVADDGTPLTIRLAIIVSGNRTAVVAGVTPTEVAENYLPTIEAIIESVEVFEPTEDDPFGDFTGDETPAGEVIPFAPGQTAEGSIPDNSFQDYQFSGFAGIDVVIAVQPTEDFDITLEIFPVDDENSLLVDEDSGFSGEAESLIFTPEADGDYIVRVSGFAGAGGDYIFAIFDPTQGLTIETTVADDAADSYRVCVPVGQPFFALVTPGEDFDPVLNLFGPAGGQLVDEVDNGASGAPEVLFFTAGVDEFTENYPVILDVAGFAGFGGDYILIIGPAGVVQDGC